jgi:hypothetical protein
MMTSTKKPKPIFASSVGKEPKKIHASYKVGCEEYGYKSFPVGTTQEKIDEFFQKKATKMKPWFVWECYHDHDY